MKVLLRGLLFIIKKFYSDICTLFVIKQSERKLEKPKDTYRDGQEETIK